MKFDNRNPGSEDILDMSTLLPDLRDKILAASNVNSSEEKLHVRVIIQNLRPVKAP